MSTEILTEQPRRHEPAAAPGETRETLVAARRQAKRVHRLKIHVTAWGVATLAITSLWVISQWQANGALESFGHEGEPGQWNPTLWALAVGIWGLIVGITALRVHFERPPTEVEIDRHVERMRRPRRAFSDETTDVVLRRLSRARLQATGRLRFHVASWILGMILLTPLWALIEWQDNGAFERFSNHSEPGDWEPWILYVGGIWALVITIRVARFYLDRPGLEANDD